MKRKHRKQTQSRIEEMTAYFLSNEKRTVSKEDLATKFFGSDDPSTCRIVSSGYVPEIRRDLEENHNKTLVNLRGIGWQVTSGGLDTFRATQQAEKLMAAYKESYKRKARTFIEDKLPKSIRRLINARNKVLTNIDDLITTGIGITANIEEAITEDTEPKEENQKE